MNVTVEPATVYRTPSGRRYLTRKGAYLAVAHRMIMRACECQPAEYGERGVCYYAGAACKYHDQLNDYGERVQKRLARHLAYNDSREGIA